MVKNKKAPFGVATKRFVPIGFHPGLDPTGSLRKIGGVGPGHYQPKEFDCAFKNANNWNQKVKTEEFSRTLGYKNSEVLKKRLHDLTSGGPGSYDISNNLYKKCEHNAQMNVTFGKQKRFLNYGKNKNPPPGTYGSPYTKIEMKRRPQFQFTPVPSFEWDGLVDRLKQPRGSCRLPPNHYNIKDGASINDLLAKKVSKRGPYDMFTGPRDNTTIKGYFAPSTFKGAKIWPRSVPNELDRLKHHSKSHYGVFLKASRFKNKACSRNILRDLSACPKDPTQPGPAHYDLDAHRPIKQNKYAFNKSVLHAIPKIPWTLSPGPGRYKHKIQKCSSALQNESFCFKSKVQRTVYKIITYNAF